MSRRWKALLIVKKEQVREKEKEKRGGEGKEEEVDLVEVTFRRGTKRRWRQRRRKR